MPKKILFLSHGPLDDFNVWSGTIYNMNKALIGQGYETEWLPTPKFSKQEENLFLRIERLYNKIFNRGFNRMQFLTKAYLSARHLKKEIKKREFDILFAPISAGEIPFLKIKQPIIYLNDANIAQLFNYNVMFTGFGWFSKRITCYLEKKTMKIATANIFSNNWGADYAVNHYNISPKKVHVCRFGSNMPVPKTWKEKEIKQNKPLELLFIAGRWELKGGDIAYDAYKILKDKGLSVNFTVVGCTPNLNDDSVVIIPFINKNTSEGLRELITIFKNTDILFLPTRNDCSPIVMCEASGYGIPSITTITGGVHEIILNDYNGYTLPLEAQGNDFAEIIEKLVKNPIRLRELSSNARKRYEDELNWEKWGLDVDNIIKNILLSNA